MITMDCKIGMSYSVIDGSKVIEYFTLLLEKVIFYCNKITCSMQIMA